MAEHLAHLHDPDNGCVHLVLPVMEDALRGAHILFLLQAEGATMDSRSRSDLHSEDTWRD